VTLGAPLGDHHIRKKLLGANEKPATRFPTNVITWHNVAAEDDYTCHDNTLADDFKKMMDARFVSAVHDHHIYNLAVRYGKSNPHSSVGYFIHPRVSKIVVDWIEARRE
jgi:aspartate-semialdehyde dehydrogenase